MLPGGIEAGDEVGDGFEAAGGAGVLFGGGEGAGFALDDAESPGLQGFLGFAHVGGAADASACGKPLNGNACGRRQ